MKQPLGDILGRARWIWLISLLLAGCGERQTRVEHGDREKFLHLGNGSDPSDLDPQIMAGEPEHKIGMAIFEGLVSEDPKTLEPRPGVAERWDVSPDLKTYTFHLRQNARWSNGDPVTAMDFYQSYERILNPALGAEYAFMLFPVRNAEKYNKKEITDFSQVGFKVVDRHTFEITLHSPTPPFLNQILHNTWYPVHIPTIKKFAPVHLRINRWTRPENIVCNGPFQPREWKLNSYVMVEKNPHYWDAENVKLKRIYFYPTESAEVEERAFRSGQLHVTYVVSIPKIQTYLERQPETIRIYPVLSTYFYRCNVTRPPLNDPRVRRALAMAIERENIVRYVTKGRQNPAHFLTPPGTSGYVCNAPFREDLEEARRLLAEAGFPNGENFPKIPLLFNTQEGHRAVAQAIQQMWRKNLNIHVELLNQEWKVYMEAMHKMDYFIARAGWVADYEDPITFLNIWVTDGGQNETGWSDPEYDRIINEASTTGDMARRMELFQKAEALLMQEMPIIPIYFYTRQKLITPSVKGWYPTKMDLHPYKYIYLEPAG